MNSRCLAYKYMSANVLLLAKLLAMIVSSVRTTAGTAGRSNQVVMDLFLDRERLPGEASLAHKEVFGRKYSYISRNHVAGGQFDDVARHKLLQQNLGSLLV